MEKTKMRTLCGTILVAARRRGVRAGRLPFVVGLALEYHQFARIVRADDFVNEAVCHGRPFGYASINSRRLASPRSKERMESARTRWFASEKNGSGVSVITSKGRRRRITIWRRNSLTPLEMSSPARLSNSSASWRRSESMRICKVDVAMLKSFVVRLNDIGPYHQSYYNRVTRQSDGISFGYGDPCGVMARTREQEGKAK